MLILGCKDRSAYEKNNYKLSNTEVLRGIKDGEYIYNNLPLELPTERLKIMVSNINDSIGKSPENNKDSYKLGIYLIAYLSIDNRLKDLRNIAIDMKEVENVLKSGASYEQYMAYCDEHKSISGGPIGDQISRAMIFNKYETVDHVNYTNSKGIYYFNEINIIKTKYNITSDDIRNKYNLNDKLSSLNLDNFNNYDLNNNVSIIRLMGVLK